MDCDNITKGQFQLIVILYNTGIVPYFSYCCVLLSHKICNNFLDPSAAKPSTGARRKGA